MCSITHRALIDKNAYTTLLAEMTFQYQKKRTDLSTESIEIAHFLSKSNSISTMKAKNVL